MVFSGLVSRGCERCRKRKVKCDERKPGCLKCERFSAQCPGYRDLQRVLFRDESTRVVQKARRNDFRLVASQSVSAREASLSSQPPNSIPFAIPQHLDYLGGNFFFARYAFDEPPFSSDFHTWLSQSFLQDGPSHALHAAVEAVGMAAIGNVFHAPGVASKSKTHYGKALAAMKIALNDPTEALADTTFMAVILLGLFETVNLETWRRFDHWEAHIKGATTLLQLRGQEQFKRERGCQLYIQIRSQILSTCMQRNLTVPDALVQTRFSFSTSIIRRQWQRRRIASAGSICEISFRIVNLRAAIMNDGITDPEVIRDTALSIDEALKIWRKDLPSDWEYVTVDAPDCFEGKKHMYAGRWIAQIWNNWRTLRILANQMLVHNETRFAVLGSRQVSMAIATIRQQSTDLCISAAEFLSAPRKMSSGITSLIEPLYLVAQEILNAPHVRIFAVQRLRWIDASMGIRRAGLLADTAIKSLDELDVTQKDAMSMPAGLLGSHYTIPRIPLG